MVKSLIKNEVYFLHTGGVVGSIPTAPTSPIRRPGRRPAENGVTDGVVPIPEGTRHMDRDVLQSLLGPRVRIRSGKRG